MERQDIILDPEEEKVYQDIHHLYLQEKPVRVVYQPFPLVRVRGRYQGIQKPGKRAKN